MGPQIGGRMTDLAERLGFGSAYLALADALVSCNLRQYMRSWYIAYFQLPRLTEWSLSRNHFALLRRGLQRTSLPGAFTDEDLERHVEAWSQPGALAAMLGWYRAV